MNKIDYGKILVVGLIVLLAGASILPSINAQTEKQSRNTIRMVPTNMGRWSDNFDGYTTGQFLDGTSDDGGWKGWDNDSQFGAYVVDDQARSAPNSVEIVDNVDLVREFSGYTKGQWTFTAWVYIPSDFVGNSYFILLSDYTDGAGQDNKWAVQMRFDADQGIVESEFDDVSLWLVYDEWVEIRCEIDLDADWLQMYYDGDLLHEKNWTAGPNNQGDGFLVIDAVDLFANGASTVYYDDLSLTGETPIPDLCCDGGLEWKDVAPGSTVTGEFQVSNCGEDGSELNWEIDSYPDWGTWTFTPSSGTGLTPAGSPVTVSVEVVAPDDPNTEFTGEVKVINSDDPGDYCIIPVSLVTPVNQHSMRSQGTQILKILTGLF